MRQWGHLWMALSKILLGSPVVQSLVRPQVIVDPLPSLKSLVQKVDLQFPIIDLVLQLKDSSLWVLWARSILHGKDGV